MPRNRMSCLEWMRVCVLWLLLAGSAAAAGAATNSVFSTDFEDAHALQEWNRPEAGVSLVQEGGTQSLRVVCPSNAPGRTVVLSRPLPVELLCGCRVQLEARVRAQDVLRPSNSWNGIKVMLHTDGPEGKRWEQPNNVFGSFDWKLLRLVTAVPPDATVAQLTIGIEQTSGTAWFDDVRLTIRRGPLPAAQAQGAEPPFKGHRASRLRGAMVHPQITPESLAVLGGQWGANLVRWQLIRYVAPGQEAALADYDAWLESELSRLDRALPTCASNGLRVVIDLHSPPGGGRTESGYIGSDKGLFTNSVAQAKFIRIWEKMARRYASNEVVWGYDIANEPVEDGVGDGCLDWQALATRTAQAIRAVDARHAIIVEPSPWGGPDAITNLDPIPVPGVVYSVHMYLPFQFTHQGIYNQPAGIQYPGMIAGKQWDKAALRRALKPVIDFQRAFNAHVYIGEFSAIRWAPGAADYLRDCIDLFEEHGWDWSYHAFREWDGWSVEHPDDRSLRTTAATPPARQKVLRSWFEKNHPPR